MRHIRAFEWTGLVIWMICLILPLEAAVTSGADFLKIPRSARAIALSGSYTAVLDDPTAIDYNPAALNTIKSAAVSLMYQTWIDNTYGLNFAGAWRFADFVLGGSVYYFNYGGIKEYDLYGFQTAEHQPWDLNYKVAASLDSGIFLDAIRGLSFGASLSAVHRNLIDTGEFGLTLDAGANYRTTVGRLIPIQEELLRAVFHYMPVNFGLAVQNIGAVAQTVSPVRFTAGLAVGVLPDLIVSMDVTKDIYETPWEFKMGAEYTLFEIVSLRAGFNLGKDTGNITMGMGIRYPFLFDNLRFDYSFAPLGILGNNHNFSLFGEIKFGVKARDYFDKGAYYFAKREYLETRKFWRKAFEMDPKDEMIRERLEQIEDVIRVYELDPKTPEVSNRVNNLRDLLDGGDRLYFRSPQIDGRRVVFRYKTSSRFVQSVSVTGDFTKWNASGIPMTKDGEEWRLMMEFDPGVYQYKFIVNGSDLMTDPANPTTAPDGTGGRNSVFEIAVTAAAVPTNLVVPAAVNATNGVKSVDTKPEKGISEPAYGVTNFLPIQEKPSATNAPDTMEKPADPVTPAPDTNGVRKSTVTNLPGTVQTNFIRKPRPKAPAPSKPSADQKKNNGKEESTQTNTVETDKPVEKPAPKKKKKPSSLRYTLPVFG